LEVQWIEDQINQGSGAEPSSAVGLRGKVNEGQRSKGDAASSAEAQGLRAKGADPRYLFPAISTLLMVIGIVLIVTACYVTNGDLLSADNKAICFLMMGAATEIMSLLLISPLAAFLLAVSVALQLQIPSDTELPADP